MPVVLRADALTTTETARDHLGIPSGDTSYDDRINRFINAATGKIETYCDRYFITRSYTEYQDGIGANKLLLDQWPAEKPSELWIDPTGKFTDTKYQIDAGDYELEHSARGDGIGLVLIGSCGRIFRRGFRNIKIVYNAGYADVDALPDEIEDACLWTVEFLYDMRNDRRIGVQTKGKNQENTTFLGDLPEFVQKTLDGYKRAEWPTGTRAAMTV